MKPNGSLFSRIRADGQTYNSYKRGLNAVNPVEPIRARHGNQIFIYRNIRTNQIIYSLTRSLYNHSALKQLPFLGKKTVPEKIRKDLWLPFALVTFPSHLQGLNAYRKLREFRRLHETSYDLAIIAKKKTDKKGIEVRTGLMNTKQRGKVLMNQRANSVADLGAVLWQAEAGPSQEEKDSKEHSKKHWARVKKQKTWAGKEVPKKQIKSPEEVSGTKDVIIRWADILDAQWAESWPDPVQHNTLERHRYTAAFPAYEISHQDDWQSIQVPPEASEASKGGEVTAA